MSSSSGSDSKEGVYSPAVADDEERFSEGETKSNTYEDVPSLSPPAEEATTMGHIQHFVTEKSFSFVQFMSELFEAYKEQCEYVPV